MGKGYIKGNEIILKDDYGIIVINSIKHGRKESLISLEDVNYCRQFTFSFAYTRLVYETVTSKIKVNGKTKNALLSRMLMNFPKGKLVDHIDHNRLDNRRCNLRVCSYSENGRNRTSRKGSTSGFLGVHWSNSHGKWVAKIRSNGHVKHLGYFDIEIEAAKAFDTAAKKIHKEFANLNFK